VDIYGILLTPVLKPKNPHKKTHKKSNHNCCGYFFVDLCVLELTIVLTVRYIMHHSRVRITVSHFSMYVRTAVIEVQTIHYLWSRFSSLVASLDIE
jgi:hypothetical protein